MHAPPKLPRRLSFGRNSRERIKRGTISPELHVICEEHAMMHAACLPCDQHRSPSCLNKVKWFGSWSSGENYRVGLEKGHLTSDNTRKTHHPLLVPDPIFFNQPPSRISHHARQRCLPRLQTCSKRRWKFPHILLLSPSRMTLVETSC